MMSIVKTSKMARLRKIPKLILDVQCEISRTVLRLHNIKAIYGN